MQRVKYGPYPILFFYFQYKLEYTGILRISIEFLFKLTRSFVFILRKTFDTKYYWTLEYSGWRYLQTDLFKSTSTSAPDYYAKLVNLSYNWFVNGTDVRYPNKDMRFRERNRDMSFIVTKDHRYNEYLCEAMEEDLVSDWSDPVHINPLCKITFMLYYYQIIKPRLCRCRLERSSRKWMVGCSHPNRDTPKSLKQVVKAPLPNARQ